MAAPKKPAATATKPAATATKPAATKPAATKPAATKEVPQLSRHQRFVKLANRRVKKTLKCLEQIANLSSSNYEYSEKEVDVLADTLTSALQKAIDKFAPKERGAKKGSAVPDLFTDDESGEDDEE